MAQGTRSSWHYLKDGVEHGPVSGSALKGLAAGGQLCADDKVWRDGLPQWVEAREVRGLFPDAGPRQLAAGGGDLASH
ncbi:MAG TPA: DUF4339 domain-containing protein [Tepidisphaeraceae bacterium]|nr:DUF4339 domain-containing protein [Tepidisphaeraceae bacterium]